MVAPLAGAWIETIRAGRGGRVSRVAPLAGAWIETKVFMGRLRVRTRRPPRGGVDRNFVEPCLELVKSRRPPRGGVDRNRPIDPAYDFDRRSPPSRGRGSKRDTGEQAPQYRAVAPLAGAWIETKSARAGISWACRRPPRGGVDRNPLNVVTSTGYQVAPLAGAWIETSRRSPRSVEKKVAPLAGAWIETGHTERKNNEI